MSTGGQASTAHAEPDIETTTDVAEKRRGGCCGGFKNCIFSEPLLFSTLLGVAVGVIIGVVLNSVHVSEKVVEVVGFPGEILMNLLRLLVLPLVAGSMIMGVCSLRESTMGMGPVARLTLGYYFLSTFLAVFLGIVTVSVIVPGRGSPFKEKVDPAGTLPKSDETDMLTAILNVLRTMFPANAVEAAAKLNILGIIMCSILFGLALAAQGEAAIPFENLLLVFNNTIEKIVIWVLYYAPFGIASLIASKIAPCEDLWKTLEGLGLFVVTVVTGLVIHSAVVLPLVFFAFARKFPWKFYKGFAPAFATAFGTDSSSATLPVTMKCAEDLGAKQDIVGFVVPLGATVNMNGTALYEAVTVIFIAQWHDHSLSLADTIIIALVSTLAAVGAAGIPEAGLVTMVLVLKAVNMDEFITDIGIIFTIDWFLDRCRTVVNVLGDGLCTMAVDSVMRKKAGELGVHYTSVEDNEEGNDGN